MATTYLTHTFGSAGDQKTFTISFWLKRSKLGADMQIFGQQASSYFRIILKAANNGMRCYSPTFDLTPSREFRDNSGWYHVCLQMDTTESVAADRANLYINGVKETVFDTETYPSLNDDLPVNNAQIHQIGRGASIDYFDGLLSAFYFIDGTAYPASTFGETDSATGEWKIITDPTVTYGTNGFLILKDGDTITDQGDNSNDWALGGGTLTNTEDCPSDVFCNFMDATTSSYTTLSNGGLTTTGNSGSDSGNSLGTLGITTGKYYFELEWDNPASGYGVFGMLDTTYEEFGHQSINGGPGYVAPNCYGINVSGNMYDGSENSSWTSAFSSGDILGFAFDMTNGAWYLHLDGTYYTSGDPTSGVSKTGAISTWTANGKTLVPWIGSYDGSITKFNFGNGYFGDTIISSEGTNASNIGKFEFDVPTGYTAISLKGLNS